MPSDYAKKKAKAKKEAAKVKGGKKAENAQKDLEAAANAASQRSSEEKDKAATNGTDRKETAEGEIQNIIIHFLCPHFFLHHPSSPQLSCLSVCLSVCLAYLAVDRSGLMKHFFSTNVKLITYNVNFFH